jgi:hypothetical protein
MLPVNECVTTFSERCDIQVLNVHHMFITTCVHINIPSRIRMHIGVMSAYCNYRCFVYSTRVHHTCYKERYKCTTCMGLTIIG